VTRKTLSLGNFTNEQDINAQKKEKNNVQESGTLFFYLFLPFPLAPKK